MSEDLSKTGLILIDLQQGFSNITQWGTERSNPDLEHNISALLRVFRQIVHNSPPGQAPLIVHIYHSSKSLSSPLHASSPGIAFAPYATPTGEEIVVSKSVNSAFIGTNLESLLRGHGINRLLIAGLTTDHCVSTTTRMAANLGVVDHEDTGAETLVTGKIILVEDAVATFNRGQYDADTMHKVSVESLKGEFCDVATTVEVIELLRRTKKAS
ncbi:hypothetical protein MMC06_002380 [Schaereria dolodes]|nr:hypothetical protein [Schaereria dolodes]